MSSAVTKARETLRYIRGGGGGEAGSRRGRDGALTYRAKLSVSFKYEDT